MNIISLAIIIITTVFSVYGMCLIVKLCVDETRKYNEYRKKENKK
jgi:hypothetical protein